MKRARLIGRFTGEQRGPLLLAVGGLHGNEPAGVRALELVLRLLRREREVNPRFFFRGRLTALCGNLQALQKGVRFVRQDINRMMTPEKIAEVKARSPEGLQDEERELRGFIEAAEAEIKDYHPDRLIVLDLHSTSAEGGIFSIATDEPVSLRLAVELHAPVITGMLRGIRGSTLHYFSHENFPMDTVAVAFESGQHDDRLSVNRSVAAVINCLRTAGCVRPIDIKNRYDKLLIDYSRNLPRVAELIAVHNIRPGDDFRMTACLPNFHPVKKGEQLAEDRHGPICAPADGHILMPLYQTRGEEGFFLVRALAW